MSQLKMRSLVRSNQPDGDGAGGAGAAATPPDPQAGTPAATATPDPQAGPATPPWGDEKNFDAQRAWNLIQAKAADLERIKAERDTFKKAQDDAETAKLSDIQKAEKERDTARTEGQSAVIELARYKALVHYGLEEDDLDFIGGTTPEAIDAAAKKYADRHGGAAKKAGPSPRPQVRLRGGSDPSTEPDETDPRKLAANIPRQ